MSTTLDVRPSRLAGRTRGTIDALVRGVGPIVLAPRTGADVTFATSEPPWVEGDGKGRPLTFAVEDLTADVTGVQP